MPGIGIGKEKKTMKHAVRVWNDMGEHRRTIWSAIVLVEADSAEEAVAKVQEARDEDCLDDALNDGEWEEGESDVIVTEQEDTGIEATEVAGDLTRFFDLDEYLAEEGEE